jgi:hypothetical protein
MEKTRNAYDILVRKPENKGSLEITGCRWDDDIHMDLKGIKCEDVNWILLLVYQTVGSHCSKYSNYSVLVCEAVYCDE